MKHLMIKLMSLLPYIPREKCISKWFLYVLMTHLIFFLLFGLCRENGSSMDGAGSLNTNKSSSEAEDLKRKQSEGASETQYPNKSPKNVEGNQQSSPSNSKRSFKKAKAEKLDWSVLRPSKGHKKRG